VVPWGFRKLLNWIKRAYNNTPVLVTGNGFSDRGETEDTERIKYIIVSGTTSTVFSKYYVHSFYKRCP
jgi:beta-glucosidase/6-phospho-beta-glucosidase/beta-galactosidase